MTPISTNPTTERPWAVRDECGEGLDRVLIVGPPDPRSKHRHGCGVVLAMRNWRKDVPAEDPSSYECVLADAALIVRAVNAHDDLVASGTATLALMEAWMGGLLADLGIRWESEADQPPALRALRKALAQAEGRTV